jgi:hypothetical protein
VRHYRKTLVAVLSIICIATMMTARLCAQGESAIPGKASPNLCVRLLSGPAINVNPVTGTGETILYIRNQLAKEVELALTGTLPTSTPFAIVEFAANESPKQLTTVYQASLKAKSEALIRMRVRNAWDDGEFDILGH